MNHIPVLLSESIDGLAIKSGGIILDGTLGGGGHTSEIAKRHGDAVKIIGVDLDADAIGRAEEKLKDIPHDTKFRVSAFQDADKVLDELNLPKVDGVLLDLGISSYQLEVAGRGFSFMREEPLLMTMKKDPTDSDVTAMDVVNTWEEESLADIIYGFGEERYSRRIAKAIVTAREKQAIKTTKELAEIVNNAVGREYKRMKINPATKTFQAIRIAVNSELTAVESSIPKLFARLTTGGRMAIISFHSLEDRIVKQEFKKLAEVGSGKIITKKPITPSEEELKLNGRSRSAKLRIIEKL
jgi:16S rRNA (cytosine1402-N4)-methyltransferase